MIFRSAHQHSADEKRGLRFLVFATPQAAKLIFRDTGPTRSYRQLEGAVTRVPFVSFSVIAALAVGVNPLEAI